MAGPGPAAKSGGAEAEDSSSVMLEKLDAEIGEAQKALEVQFIRMAQMQQEINVLRAQSKRKGSST
jgi:hypothetical protein